MWLTGAGATVQRERDVIAQQARAAAEPTRALCRTPSQVAPVLAASGLCANAETVLASPIVTEVSSPLPAAQLDAIVASVLPVFPTAPGTTPVSEVLATLAADPATDALDAASTRAVVAGAVGSTDPDPAVDPPAGSGAAPQPDPERVTGLRFEEVDGRCEGVVTLVREDGATREERSAAPAGSCGMTPPPPDPSPGPGPGPEPEPSPEPEPEPEPTTEPADPSSPAAPGEGLPGPGADGSVDSPAPTGTPQSPEPTTDDGLPGGLSFRIG